MFIRGIDFARHNIIVGTESEHPLPANTQAFQPRGELVARVLSVTGSEATLVVAGQRVVVESHVPLNAGDKLFVRVSEGQGGLIRFSLLASGPEDGLLPAVADADVDALLRELGLPADDRTRHAARALLARDGTIEKPALAQLLADLRQFPTVTAREAGAAALLQKAQAPVNPATVELVAQRAQPEAPVQLAPRLAALAPALEDLKRQWPAGSPKAAVLNELIKVLSGLPLGEGTHPAKVSESLRDWMQRLQPAQAGPAAASANAPAARLAVGLPAAALPEAMPTPTPASSSAPGPSAPPVPTAPAAPAQAPVHNSLNPAAAAVASAELALAEAANPAPAGPAAPAAAAEQAPAAPPAKPAGEPGVKTPEAGSGQPGALQGASHQASEQARRVPASQNVAPRMGITAEATPPGKADLASLLERLTQALGPEHKPIKQLVKEALAELRYAQLTNGPAPQGAERPEYLVPLMLPQLFQEVPEGRIQVFHKPARPGEPLDPDNVRLVFVLNTEHLGTVQADLTIKAGVVDLAVGLDKHEDRKFMTEHLAELEQAIAKLGWPTGRFGTRVAKGPPPRVRQEEGLSEIVHFDRRV